MSLILEALKRADRERRLERAPDLSAVYEDNDLPGHNGIRPWIWLCGSFLVGVIVVGLLLWPGRPGPVKPPPPKSESTSQLSSAPGIDKKGETPPSSARVNEDLQPKKPSAQKSSGQPAWVPVREAKPVQSNKKMTEKITPLKTEPKPVEKKPEHEPVIKEGKSAVSKPVPVAPEKKKEPFQSSPAASPPSTGPVKTAASDKSKSVEKPVAAEVVKPAAPPPPPPVPQEDLDRKRIEAVPLIGTLPYETKEKLGKLEINVHSYSNDPNERLVFINMKSYKVGDRIGEGGPLLKEITPNGVIIDYGGEKVRLQIR